MTSMVFKRRDRAPAANIWSTKARIASRPSTSGEPGGNSLASAAYMLATLAESWLSKCLENSASTASTSSLCPMNHLGSQGASCSRRTAWEPDDWPSNGVTLPTEYLGRPAEDSGGEGRRAPGLLRAFGL